MSKKQTIASKLDGKYITKDDVKAKGGKWDANGAVYVFPDNSIGRFSDIKNGGLEQTRTGESVLHFVDGGMMPDDD